MRLVDPLIVEMDVAEAEPATSGELPRNFGFDATPTRLTLYSGSGTRIFVKQ